jgi:hypothetical protein
VARSRARAPAMFLPWVTVRDRSGGMTCSPQGCIGAPAYRRQARPGLQIVIMALVVF